MACVVMYIYNVQFVSSSRLLSLALLNQIGPI